MTQIIFQVAAIACIVYTACSFGLFIHKRIRKSKNIGKTFKFLRQKLPPKWNRTFGKIPFMNLP